MFHKKTVREVPLDGQRVLVRADYNVPLINGKIDDDYRMVQSLKTVKYLIDRGCQVVICSHLGRPDGVVKSELSLEPVAAHLGDLLNQPVGFIPECVGDRVVQATRRLSTGQVLLLENLRFHPEEEANDPGFAHRLAQDSGATYFVQDGFAVVHRAHASTSAITQFLPSVAGLLLEHEVTTITEAMERPKHPLVAILGGAKVTDKIKIIHRFIGLADQLVIGGEMANTFLKYKGLSIGKSLHEDGQEEVIEDIYTRALEALRGKTSVDEFIVLPSDVVVAPSTEKGAPVAMVAVTEVPAEDYILDLGAASTRHIATILKDAATVIWNGTLGMAEQAAYAHASALVAETLANQDAVTKSIVGGGDTADFVLHWSKEHKRSFGYISTGGGASLDLMSGESLPGVDSLLDK